MAVYNPEDDLERLYLLEVLVDCIRLDISKLKLEEGESPPKGICVSFKFLNHPPLNVCECDFYDKEDTTADLIFKSGKSSLFSLRHCIPEVKNFKIYATVYGTKKDAPNSVIGKFTIELCEGFLRIINADLKECESGPISQSIREKYMILNENKEPVGSINIFVRLSCYGKMIVTQFKIRDEEKELFSFKGNQVTKDEKQEPCEGSPMPCAANERAQKPPGYSEHMKPIQSYQPQGHFPVSNQYPFMYRPPLVGGLMGGAALNYPQYPMSSNFYGSAPPMSGLLGGSMGVPMQENCEQNNSKKISNVPFCGRLQFDESSSSSDDEPSAPIPLLNFCSCDYPIPPGFSVPAPQKKKRKKKKKTCPFDIGGKFCARCDCPMGLPQYPGMKKTPKSFPEKMESDTLALMDDKIIMQMAPYPTQPLTMMPASVMPDMSGMPGFYPPAYSPDDLYSLRFGRQDQNAKVEIAFEKQMPPPRKPCRHHEETQYRPEDFGGEPAKADAGKKANKKGANKKGKKGKKK